MKSRIVSLVGLLLLASCAARPNPSARPRACPSWIALGNAVTTSFALVSCVEINPEEWVTAESSKADECTVGDVKAIGRPEPDSLLGSFAEVSSIADPTRRVVTIRAVPPRESEDWGGPSAGAPLGCDSEVPRVYVGSSYLGEVVAFRPDGRELWRLSLPNFQSAVDLPLADKTRRGRTKLLDSEGSILKARLVPHGPFVAVSYLVKGHHHTAVIHRSGEIVATLGPWDGIVTGATPDGLVFDGGGEAAYGDWRLPVEELTLRLTASSPELLIDHFLSFNLPRPTDTGWSWRKCDGENRFVRLDLATRFDPKLNEIAWKIHDGLGTDWARKMAADAAMANVMFRDDLPFHDWKAKVRAALLHAGADVDCMRYAREHQLIDAAVR